MTSGWGRGKQEEHLSRTLEKKENSDVWRWGGRAYEAESMV